MRFYICLLAIATILSVYSCSTSGNEKYNKLVKTELAKATRTDSLFLGLTFGMTCKEFYGYCWELNKKGIISDGANNTMVLYKLDSALKFPATMDFYPDFTENKISNMRVSFQYNAWAIWNKAQSADSLLPAVLGLLEKWYPKGNGFIAITNKAKGTIYVKIDGNRRITVGKFDDMVVKAEYTDLLTEDKLKR